MANEFKVKKGLIVQGSGSTGDNTILDVQGNQGQLFSITDSLSGSLFSVGDISGIPILEVFSDETVKIGTFGSEGLIVNGSNVTSSGNISASGQFIGADFGLDSTDKLQFSDGTLQFRLNDASRITHTSTVFRPTSDEGVSLGRTAEKWKELVVNHVTASGNISVSGTVDGRDIATDGTKLDGIAANANNYVLPTNLAGDDIDIDTGALTGATVVSDIDINITTNTSGLVTDANGSVSTRTLTKGDLGLGNVPNSDHTAQGYATGDNFDADGTFASLRAQGTTKGDVGLGNVTNESKATMFTNPTFTGTTAAPTPSANDDSTKIATTAYVQQELTDLIGTAPAALDTLGELSASLANDQDALASLTTTVGTKLAKSSNLSDLTNASTARTNLGLGTAATSDTGDFATAAQGTKADNALPKSGGTMTGAIAMGNFNITGINALTFNDPGPNEGLSWSGGNMKLYESPDDLTTNSAGNLQFVYGSTRRLTVNNTGIDVNGNVTVSGTVDGRDIATDGTKLDTIATNADVTPAWVPSTNPNYLTDYTVTSGDVTAHEGDITITESQISDLGNYATGDNFDADGTFASLRAQGTTKGDVGLGNVANESRATILGGNLTGTINNVAVATVTAGAALGATSNQDSTATIRSGTTAANVGLGNVTNESKATMFASPTFTGTTAAPTPSANDNSTKIATTAYVQQELTDLIGTAPAALDTLGELSASLANDQDALASLTTTVGTKLAKSSNLSDLADAGTARTNLGVDAAGTDNSTDVTLAGSYDYITISGQTITRNQVDYNTDISNTPTIPTNNNQLTNGAGFTTNTGTVTNVTVGTGLDVSNGTTTPSITLDLSELTDMTSTMVSTDEFIVLDNGAERRKAVSEIGLNLFSNNAGFLTRADLTRDVINALPIANGGTGATTAGAALTALGAAASSHTHAASDITSGTLDAARIPDDMDSGKVKQICTTHHNFFMNSTANPPTADFFVPFNNLNESSNPTNTQYYNRTVAPYGGRLVKIALHTTAAIGNACKAQFWIANSTGTFASYTEEVTGIDLNTANSSDTATFSSATFSEGDVIGVSIIKSTTATANMQVTLVWEYTL